MPMRSKLTKADITIIGAGVMGASIAWQLSKRTDKSILVLDQYTPLGGMSGRSFGQIRLHYSNALMLQMAMRGYDYFANWDKFVGYGDSGYLPMGYMLIVVEKQLEALNRNIELAQSLGIETRFVDPKDIKAIEPCINTDGLVGGAWDPNGGFIDITRIVLAWLSASQEAGVKVATGVKVEGILTKGDTVTGLRTSAGEVEASLVIDVTGSWGKELVKTLGIDVPVEPRRIDTMYLTQPPGGRQLGCCLTDGNSNIAIRPHMGREFLAGAYPPEMPVVSPIVDSDAENDQAHLRRIHKSLSERLPDFVDATPVRSVSGSYDVTPDWHPILGWVPGIDGLYLATGFSGHGLKLAPSVGETVADQVLGREPDFDISPLRLGRFADNEPMFCAYGPGARA